MQKGYITFSTISSLQGEGQAVRSRWADQVSSVSKKHNEYIQQIEQGSFYPGIEVDPRDSVLQDSKYDLKTLPGYKGLSS